MFSFRQFPGVLVLIANVSEPSIISIFMGRWMKNDWDGTVRCIYAWRGCGRKVAEPMGVRMTRRGGWSHNWLWKGEAYIRRCDDLPATITHVQVAAVLVWNTPDDGRLRPKHVEWICRNKTCTVLHQVGVSFDLYYDARKHKIKIFKQNFRNEIIYISSLRLHFSM